MIINKNNYGTVLTPKPISAKITVDGEYINLDNFGCFLIGKNTKRGSPKFEIFKSKNSFVRHITNKEDTDDTLQLKFRFVGASHEKLWERARELSNMLERCIIHLGTEDYYYDCILKGYGDDEFKDWTTLDTTITFNCQCYSPEEQYQVSNRSGLFHIHGAKPTPISFEIKALTNISNERVNDIVIKDLKQNEVLEIDSFNCRVLINGKNAINKVQIFDFPRVKGKYKVDVSTLGLDVKIKYRARW